MNERGPRYNAKRVRIAPSLLSADFSRLADEVAMCEAGGADWLHVDVMDGVFVPNLTFGSKVIATVRKLTKLPLDVHLMVVEPEKYFDDFVKAGATGLPFTSRPRRICIASCSASASWGAPRASRSTRRRRWSWCVRRSRISTCCW